MRAKKRLGQHFLTDQSILAKIADFIPPQADTLLEIGPGRGALTSHLIGRARRIVAVEFDRDLIPQLHRQFARIPGFEILQQDILNVDLQKMSETPMIVIGNIPYNITSPLLDWACHNQQQIALLVLMVQRELACRMTAEPNSSDWSPLAIMTRLFFDSRLCFDVPPDCFDPPPKVWSSVVTLSPHPVRTGVDHARFRSLLGVAFGHKRKQLRNNLVPAVMTAEQFSDWCRGLSLKETVRAEQLSIEQLLMLQHAVERIDSHA